MASTPIVPAMDPSIDPPTPRPSKPNPWSFDLTDDTLDQSKHGGMGFGIDMTKAPVAYKYWMTEVGDMNRDTYLETSDITAPEDE